MAKKTSLLLWAYWGAITILVFTALGFEAFTFFRNTSPPTDSTVLFIKPGLSVREISRQLQEGRVLDAPWKLRLLARVTGKQKELKPGEYRFDVPSPPWRVLRTMVEGKVILHKVTIPEGFAAKEIVATLVLSGLADRQDLMEQLVRKDLLARLRVPGGSFEGFLFPDTYFFSKTDETEKMLETMVARFRQNITPDDVRKSKELGLNLLQWITLASIIEKESSVPAEHPIISSVFHNRLKKKMRLQSDPTVIYGIPDFDGNLTRKDLETPTPYNTYTQGGLPPGPIANPGASAIHAAVNPGRTEYLYFVADRQGKHVFSKTYEEHQKAVATFQLSR
jgi:UPF0755 protein